MQSTKNNATEARACTVDSGALRAEDSILGRLVFQQTCKRHRVKRDLAAPADTPEKGSPLLRLNTVCPYYTMFPLSFPLKHLAESRPDEWVLDPFCGRGTTLFAARLVGLRSVGIDSNPLAAAIAAAKLASTSASAVVTLAESILADAQDPTELPEGEFWRLCFHPTTLREVCIIRERLLQSCSSAEEIVLRALMLGILHGPLRKQKPTYLSNQMPRTYSTKPTAAVRFWKKRCLTTPPEVDLLDAIRRRAEHALSAVPMPAGGAVYYGDARRADSLLPEGRRFSWVITSPPYLGMRTYRSDQWLRNWFLGGSAAVEYAHEGELVHHAGRYAEELATAWRAVAKRCVPGARLIVRFGYLPSVLVDAREILRESLELSGSGWLIQKWADAGSADNGKRQAEQFGRPGRAAHEVDVYARLEA